MKTETAPERDVEIEQIGTFFLGDVRGSAIEMSAAVEHIVFVLFVGLVVEPSGLITFLRPAGSWYDHRLSRRAVEGCSSVVLRYSVSSVFSVRSVFQPAARTAGPAG